MYMTHRVTLALPLLVHRDSDWHRLSPRTKRNTTLMSARSNSSGTRTYNMLYTRQQPQGCKTDEDAILKTRKHLKDLHTCCG